MEKVRTVLIASGSGTDAKAIMLAHKNGFIPNIDITALVSTKFGAGCVDKANAFNIASKVINQDILGREGFNRELDKFLQDNAIQLVFLVGCIVRINILPDIAYYNIHPADIESCGGKGMYGLDVHIKVLADIKDKIDREKADVADRFFTTPTVHEVVKKFDSGSELLKTWVEIPRTLISQFINKEIDIKQAAEKLQKHVLPYEWQILPTSVLIAASKINDV